MTYVAFAFPSLSLCVFCCYHLLTISVELYVAFWFVLQLVELCFQISGFWDISAAAHIAGAIAGAILFFSRGSGRSGLRRRTAR